MNSKPSAAAAAAAARGVEMSKVLLRSLGHRPKIRCEGSKGEHRGQVFKVFQVFQMQFQVWRCWFLKRFEPQTARLEEGKVTEALS